MKTTEECLEALAKGKTLSNQYGNCITLKDGLQVRSGKPNKKRKEPYSFSSPEYWYIVKSNKHLEAKTEQPRGNLWFILWGVFAFAIGFEVALWVN